MKLTKSERIDLNEETTEGLSRNDELEKPILLQTTAVEIEENPRANVVNNIANTEKIDDTKVMESKYTNEPECDTTFQDIKTIQSTQSVHTGNGNSAQNSISVPIVEISSVMENKNIQSGRKMSIEKSASHSELPKKNKLDRSQIHEHTNSA